MKRMLLLMALMLMVVGVGGADAKLARAGTDTFTAAKGSWFAGSNWSQGVKPTKTVEVVIPAGRVAQIGKLGAEAGSTVIAGRVEGPQSMVIYGSVKIEPGGELDLDEGLTVTGLGSIDLGGETPYYLRLKGWHNLLGPVTVVRDLDVEGSATLYTGGYELTVPRETYFSVGSTVYLEHSVVNTGGWFIYGTEYAKLDATHATVNIDRPVVEGEAFGNTFFDGDGWTYGNVRLEGFEPQTQAGFNVTGTLRLERSFGGIRFDRAHTVEAAAIATDGTAAEPAVVQSSVPGTPYTIRLAHDETVEGCLAISHAHVEGGILTDPCAGDLGGNTGVVFEG